MRRGSRKIARFLRFEPVSFSSFSFLFPSLLESFPSITELSPQLIYSLETSKAPLSPSSADQQTPRFSSLTHSFPPSLFPFPLPSHALWMFSNYPLDRIALYAALLSTLLGVLLSLWGLISTSSYGTLLVLSFSSHPLDELDG